MENTLEKITELEEKITTSINLLEIVKGYCEHNFDKGESVCAIISLLDVVLNDQKNLAQHFDELVLQMA